MLLFPNENEEKCRKAAGIGTPAARTKSEMTHELIKATVRTSTRQKRAPLDWSRSDAFVSAKNNGKKGTDGCRLLHVLCPVGKSWAKVASQSNIPDVPHSAFGFLRGRRREGAILAQQVAGWKAKEAGLSGLSCYHDMRSAFSSTLDTELKATVEDLYSGPDRELMTWRYSMSTITLETEHGRQVHIINSGGLIGDTACPNDFVHTFAKCIRDWQLRPGSTEPMRMALITKSPVTGHTTDLSISTFADDIAKKHVGKDTQQTVDMAHMASLALDVSLWEKATCKTSTNER